MKKFRNAISDSAAARRPSHARLIRSAGDAQDTKIHADTHTRTRAQHARDGARHSLCVVVESSSARHSGERRAASGGGGNDARPKHQNTLFYSESERPKRDKQQWRGATPWGWRRGWRS